MKTLLPWILAFAACTSGAAAEDDCFQELARRAGLPVYADTVDIFLETERLLLVRQSGETRLRIYRKGSHTRIDKEWKYEAHSGVVWMPIVLEPRFLRQGYGYEAMRALIQWSFEKDGARVIYAIIYDENEASVALHEKLGFRKGSACGKAFRYEFTREDLAKLTP